jgi:addiction module HigA family antidote
MTATHPGAHVREVFMKPRGLSVSAAAKLVGVGRPAFSNFVNGNASATPEMAARLEVAFGVGQADVMAMQAAYDVAQSKAKAAPAEAVSYTAPFLELRARDMEDWAQRNVPARSRFAVLLRYLVHSTGRNLKSVDFPGNDDAERAGWDGHVETSAGTPWIPEGVSGWEFGTNENPKGKADQDFDKTVKAIPDRAERDAMTFVFVTPRHWPGKAAWIAAQRRKKKWRDVRAYDSSDLEQWLEQSIAAQAWLARELKQPTNGVRTLDQSWEDWAGAANPKLPGALFGAAVGGARTRLANRLKAAPEGPIVVAADSTGEAIAFIAQFFQAIDDPALVGLRDRVLVFDEPGVVKRIATGACGFVAVAHTRSVEQELAPLMHALHCIVVYPRNAANVEPDVVLEPLNYESFWEPLEHAGFSRDKIARLEKESGRSLTVLRRRLSKSPGVRTPAWATNPALASQIAPFLWAGTWDATKASDRDVLTLLANESSYDVLEERCQALAQLNDPPMWSIGHYRGATSKIDLLFAAAPVITEADLNHFFEIAPHVLGEDDPRLDLPEDKRWAASIYGKSREFSCALRRGIGETLVLLSVYGRQLFWDRLGVDCEARTGKLVSTLLTPLKTRLLEANDNDLAAYAEASPDVFLGIIENDLKQQAPETIGLMRPAAPGIFGGGAPRTGLLWALEGLAWSSRTLPRVALILAQLSQVEIKDNWANKPIGSLEDIFRAWMPQTSADVPERLAVLKTLATKFPKVAWHICIDQFKPGSRTGTYSHKPTWRNDGQGFGEPVEGEAVWAFCREAASMLFDWKAPYTSEMLCNLIHCLPTFSPEHHARAWEIIAAWATDADDAARAIVREQVRQKLLSRRVKRIAIQDEIVALTAAAKKAREALEPRDVIQKHEWLFRQHWVEESADEMVSEDLDYEARHERVTALRAQALHDVLAARGVEGLIEISRIGDAAGVVGHITAQRVLAQGEVEDALRAALRHPPSPHRRSLMAGLLGGLTSDARAETLDDLKSDLQEAEYVEVLLSADFRRTTWNRVQGLSPLSQSQYWSAVYPDWVRNADDEAAEGVECLIKNSRPRAAFHSIHLNIDKADPELLFRLLDGMATNGAEPDGSYIPHSYELQSAFERIEASNTISLERKAVLELAYIDVLAGHGRPGGRGVPNLERYVDQHPELFVQAVVWTYRRKGDGADPPELTPPTEQAEVLAHRGMELLRSIERIPGRDKDGEVKADSLVAWITAVRSQAEAVGRMVVADICIGEMIAHAPEGVDGIWPCEPVRDALEEVRSEDIMRGVGTGLFNRRGAVWRGPDGTQERELAAKYQAWVDALMPTHPFVASTVLTAMMRTYEVHAREEDTQASIMRRMGRA